ALLWAETTGCPLDEAGFCLVSLGRKSLLTLDGDFPRRRVSLHDLQHDYLKGTHPDLRKAHNQVLLAYRGRHPDGWPTVRPDGYFFEHLLYHLSHAGMKGQARELLFNFQWLQAKLASTNIAGLVADFDYFPGDKELDRVCATLRLSAHILASS